MLELDLAALALVRSVRQVRDPATLSIQPPCCGVEADDARGQLVVDERDVEVPVHLVAAGSPPLVANPVTLYWPEKPLKGRLIGDDAQHAGLRRGAEQRALRARQGLDPLDVHQVRADLRGIGSDGLVVEVNARLGVGIEILGAPVETPRNTMSLRPGCCWLQA